MFRKTGSQDFTLSKNEKRIYAAGTVIIVGGTYLIARRAIDKHNVKVATAVMNGWLQKNRDSGLAVVLIPIQTLDNINGQMMESFSVTAM